MDTLILKSFIPELFLIFTILLQLIHNTFKSSIIRYNFPLMHKELYSQTFFILVITLILLYNVQIEGITSNFLLINDASSIFIKIIFLISVLFIFIFIWQSFVYNNLNFFEYFILFFFIILSALLLISAYDLFSIYLFLELQALCFYIITGIQRNSTFSLEAALKYFIIGSIFSCFYLVGACLIYGELGTTNFYLMNLLLVVPSEINLSNNLTLLVGTFLILSTLFFKLSIAPLHYWIPDVYDGAPLSSTIILAVLPKLIISTVLVRYILSNYDLVEQFSTYFIFCGLLSFFLGTIHALKQKRFKRLFIFSSISQLGFLIILLIVLNIDSVTSVYLFLIVYNLTAVLGWGSISSIYLFQKQAAFLKLTKKFPTFLSNLNNLFEKNKIWSFIFLIFFFSLAGMPPFIGFFGKFYIFLSLIQVKMFSFAISLMLFTSFSVFYYLRVLKIIFFETKKTNFKINSIFQGNFNYLYKDFSSTALVFSCFLIIWFFFFPNFLLLTAKYIALNFFGY